MANEITVNVHDARPEVTECGECEGRLWLAVKVGAVDVTLFFRDPLVAVAVGEQLAAAGKRLLADMEDFDAELKSECKAERGSATEPWVG